MKNWTAPEVAVLEISETAHNWTGIYRDGGYIGDGEISGHLQWTEPTPVPTQPTQPTEPTQPTQPTDPEVSHS